MKYAHAYSYYAGPILNRDNVAAASTKDNLVDESDNQFIDHDSNYIVVSGPERLIDASENTFVDHEGQYIITGNAA